MCAAATPAFSSATLHSAVYMSTSALLQRTPPSDTDVHDSWHQYRETLSGVSLESSASWKVCLKAEENTVVPLEQQVTSNIGH